MCFCCKEAVSAFSRSVVPSSDAVDIDNCVVWDSNEAVATDNCVVLLSSDDVAAATKPWNTVGSPKPAIVDDWMFVLAICTTPPSTLNISPASATPEAETFTAVSKILDWFPFVNGTLCSTLIGMKLLLIS